MFKKQLGALYIPVGLFLTTFAIYVYNLSPSVYGGDSGDFLSAIAVKGVAHPSGYPLYTLLGILFSFLPIHQSLAWKVDLLSALFSSLAVVVMYKIVYELTEEVMLAIITSLTLAFLFPFWLFAEVSEVFALHSFFLLLLFYLGLLFYKRRQIVYPYLLSFFTGLSFTNHELTLFILPTIFIFVFAARKKIALSAKIIGKCFGLFILGLLPYLYIPIAASYNPPINWDQASTIGNFIKLVTRADYGWGVRGGTTTAFRFLSFQQYMSYIVSSLSIFLIGAALFGAYALVRRKQFTILSAILASYILCGPVYALYHAYLRLDNFFQGIDEKFYTSSMLFLLLLVPFGVLYIIEFFTRMFSGSVRDAKPLPVLGKIILGLFALAPLWLFFTNISRTDLHSVWVGDMLGRDILTPLPKNSYVVSTEDDFAFNSQYMQYAYGIRKDVRVRDVADFTHFISTQSLTKQPPSRIGGMKQKTVEVSLDGPVFVVSNDYNETRASDRASSVPFGLLLQRVFTKEDIPPRDEYIRTQQAILAGLEKSAHAMPPAESLSHLKLIADIPLWYARAFANTGLYLIAEYRDYETARKYFQKALAIDPNTDIAYEGLGDYAFYKHDCRKAQEAYENATEINFLNRRVYQKLYTVVDKCLHDRAKAQQLQDFFLQYPDIFGKITSGGHF